MNGSQLMGLGSVNIDIYNIHGYFRKLTMSIDPRILRHHKKSPKNRSRTTLPTMEENCSDRNRVTSSMKLKKHSKISLNNHRRGGQKGGKANGGEKEHAQHVHHFQKPIFKVIFGFKKIWKKEKKCIKSKFSHA